MIMYLSTLLRVLFVSYLVRQPKGFRLCGNYCGPDYCNGKYQTETFCVLNKTWLNSTDPIDECCKIHDFCCGSVERSINCNKNILKCLHGINGKGVGCTNLNDYEMDVLFFFLRNNICGEIKSNVNNNKYKIKIQNNNNLFI